VQSNAELLTSAKCLGCLSPQQQEQLVIYYLFQIALTGLAFTADTTLVTVDSTTITIDDTTL
jgi:isocitrate lyase